MFYLLLEESEAGAAQFRLCGLYFASPKGMTTDNLEYDVTKYKCDVVLPTNHFNMCYAPGIGGCDGNSANCAVTLGWQNDAMVEMYSSEVELAPTA